MCLLDEVGGWDDEAIHARSASHRAAGNPLRSDGQLRAVHLCEYGAQAMAVHGGLVARAAGTRAEPVDDVQNSGGQTGFDTDFRQ
jgi:predicted hotdog family 3-hydroxylacyl-ACP dehydratase